MIAVLLAQAVENVSPLFIIPVKEQLSEMKTAEAAVKLTVFTFVKILMYCMDVLAILFANEKVSISYIPVGFSVFPRFPHLTHSVLVF